MLKGDVSKTVTRSKQKCIILLFLLATHSLNYNLDPNVKPHPSIIAFPFHLKALFTSLQLLLNI